MILRHGILRGLRPCRLDWPKAAHFRYLNDAATTDAPPSKHTQSVAEDVRSLMRQIPHPLTVILAQDPTTASPPAGLLVSSFNTVTLYPTPYVSFNLKLPSSTYDAIKASRTFTASAVADVQLAKDFLLDKRAEGYVETMRSNVDDQHSGLLKPGRGAIWWMKCRWAEQKSQPVGDHVIVVAEVLGAAYYTSSVEGKARASDKPLIYSEGKYRNAGQSIAKN
ncbi:MAG: hypothetical protein Q9169_001698 [Polycauliona sp. 2 TL-2023]